jgi:hypothetical protein
MGTGNTKSMGGQKIEGLSLITTTRVKRQMTYKKSVVQDLKVKLVIFSYVLRCRCNNTKYNFHSAYFMTSFVLTS